jgi:uncharacterized metal-binding protein
MTNAQFKAPKCGSCPIRQANERLCLKKDGQAPPECPTANHHTLSKSIFESLYKNSHETLKFAQNAAKVERACYRPGPAGGLEPAKPRMAETVHFAKKMGYRKLGLIFCFGLREEAAVVTKILETNGFEVVSVACKVGSIPKSDLGIAPEDQLKPNSLESMCNPILQAELMNRSKVDFNVLLGLCVGHDSLALKQVEAPVTVLAVKDRALGNNPLACVYLYNSFMSYFKKPLADVD